MCCMCTRVQSFLYLCAIMMNDQITQSATGEVSCKFVGIPAACEVILGQVVAKANNYVAVPSKGGARRIIKADNVRAYEKSFKRQCKVYAGKMIDRAFKLEIVVYFQTRAADLDNALKTLLDCMQQCRCITDDKLCAEIHARKAIDPNNPRVVFALHELEPMLF